MVGPRPRRAVPFLDRTGPRAKIGEFLASRRELERTGLVCVHARAGLGSYSLAAEVYEDHRQAVGDCPYLEVHAAGADGQALPPEDLLGQALRGLGLAEGELAATDAGRRQAYQQLSAGRRFVLLVKDVVDVAQVEPLIPAAAPSAVVLVTSRRALRRLYARDFLAVPLDKLPAEEARELLLTALGATAAELDDALIDELGELCDGHPLLIRLVAAHLLGRARVAEPLVTRTRRSRAALLELDVTQPVASSLTLAHDGLKTDLARLYRRTALLPGPDFTVDAAAIACAAEVGATAEMLDELVDACLLTYDEPSGRYSYHDLVREHAKLRAQTDEPAEVRDAVIGRAVRWYLEQAAHHDSALSGRWRIGEVFTAQAASGRSRPTRDEAIRWFDAEWRNVVDCVAEAANAELNDVAWQLCVALFKFLHMHGHTTAWLETHRIGLDAAAVDGARTAVMQLSSQRGAAWAAVGELDEALTDFQASLEIARQCGHALGTQSNLEWLGKVAARRGNFDDALRYYDESEQVITESGAAIPPEQAERMRALLHLQRARALLAQDNPEAVGAAARALEFFDAASGERENSAKCRLVLGAAHEDRSIGAEAYRGAAELFAADGLTRLQAEAWHGVGRRHPDHDTARHALERARDLYATVGDVRENEVGQILGA
ncbi:NB-ARC domain-containing protein [Amycolatopsis lurida]